MLENLIEKIGEPNALALGGLIIGLIFGACAQYSRFCLRSATLEVAHGIIGQRLATWLFVFSTALIGAQTLLALGLFDTGSVRQLNNTGSLSGSIVGGLMFGAGMTLSRACGSRMLVLSGTGNLRALLSGLIFAVVAQMSRDGVLSPAREAVGRLWTIDASMRDLLALTKIGRSGAIAFGFMWLAAAIAIALRSKLPVRVWVTGAGVGASVAAAWGFTYYMSAHAFDVAPVQAISFTSPSADMLMYVLAPPGGKLTFDLGLVPGVVLGAFLSGALKRELKLEGFHGGHSMRRYIAGGCLMGFGGVLAAGCAVGAGVSGASVFALTAWVVLWSMWVGAVVTDFLIDRNAAEPGHVLA
jgi:uncharacterized membrane protein YedE/YeeE